MAGGAPRPPRPPPPPVDRGGQGQRGLPGAQCKSGERQAACLEAGHSPRLPLLGPRPPPPRPPPPPPLFWTPPLPRGPPRPPPPPRASWPWPLLVRKGWWCAWLSRCCTNVAAQPSAPRAPWLGGRQRSPPPPVRHPAAGAPPSVVRSRKKARLRLARPRQAACRLPLRGAMAPRQHRQHPCNVRMGMGMKPCGPASVPATAASALPTSTAPVLNHGSLLVKCAACGEKIWCLRFRCRVSA